MSPWLLALVVPVSADPGADLIHQRILVEEAAAEVARARGIGRRREVAAKMQAYREAAARLEALEQRTAEEPASAAAARRVALAGLTDALARGTRHDGAREVLEAWLGPFEPRLALLASALSGALDARGPIRRGLLLDVAEQSEALALLLAYDADLAERRADQLELHARSLRRTGPGQGTAMAGEVEALRLVEEAEALEALAVEARQRRGHALALRRRAADQLREAP